MAQPTVKPTSTKEDYDSGRVSSSASSVANFFESDVTIVAQWDKKWKDELRQQQKDKKRHRRRADKKRYRPEEEEEELDKCRHSRRHYKEEEKQLTRKKHDPPIFLRASDDESLAGDHSGSDSEEGIKQQRRKNRRRTMRSNAFSDEDDYIKSTIKDDSEVPRVPPNPLNAAYHEQSYRLSQRQRRSGCTGDREQSMISGQAVEEKEEIWDHDKFRERSLSPERPAPSDTWDSRKGNWKARAGGVYIPPERDPDDADRSTNAGTIYNMENRGGESDFHRGRYWTNA